MRIGILGTGGVARRLAEGFRRSDHDVVLGTRDPDATLARTDADGQGNPPFATWAAAHGSVPLVTFGAAAAHGEVLVNAVAGHASVATFAAVAAADLAGKVLLDVGNVLDFSDGWPPRVATAGGESLAEQLQAAFPEARVVKSLNTVTGPLMVDPAAVGDGDHTMFVSGDDASAKAIVEELLRELGWRDVLDLGDIVSARGQEHYFALWAQLVGANGGDAMFNVRVVRSP